VTFVGVDGCKAGWIAVIRQSEATPLCRVFAEFAALIDAVPTTATIAVDMPIGLPERSGKGGRGPEALVRPLLGGRQSSVFSIPSRAAVYAETAEFASLEERHAAHRRACEVALATSEPSRKVSIQAFGIFPKIRELDRLLRAKPDLARRVVESHPEVAFWLLNGRRELANPKKAKAGRGEMRPVPAGMEERRALLARNGYDRAFLDRKAPPGAAADDFLDACAMALVAERVAAGLALSFPDPPGIDVFGLPVAIRV
jgi:predicted RNase H-like nuclease